MDEDFALWNFIEAERDRYAEKDSSGSSEAEEEEVEEDELDEDELVEQMAEKFGQGIIRQGGNY